MREQPLPIFSLSIFISFYFISTYLVVSITIWSRSFLFCAKSGLYNTESLQVMKLVEPNLARLILRRNSREATAIHDRACYQAARGLDETSKTNIGCSILELRFVFDTIHLRQPLRRRFSTAEMIGERPRLLLASSKEQKAFIAISRRILSYSSP